MFKITDKELIVISNKVVYEESEWNKTGRGKPFLESPTVRCFDSTSAFLSYCTNEYGKPLDAPHKFRDNSFSYVTFKNKKGYITQVRVCKEKIITHN